MILRFVCFMAIVVLCIVNMFAANWVFGLAVGMFLGIILLTPKTSEWGHKDEDRLSN